MTIAAPLFSDLLRSYGPRSRSGGSIVKQILALAAVLLGAGSAMAQFNVEIPSSSGMQQASPSVTAYPDGAGFVAVPVEEDVFFPAVKGAPSTKMLYSEWSCDAGWDETCTATFSVDAPANSQACRPIYRVSTQVGQVALTVTPSRWYTGDAESPDRFRSYRFDIWMAGSGEMWNRWGSSLRLNNVGIIYLPASATNADRYRWGCDMPPHD